jgi:hypothetical protein
VNIDRIIKFCHTQIGIQNTDGDGLFLESVEVRTARTLAYESVIDFIVNSDKAKQSDVDKIKEIYQRHYELHISKLTKRKRSTVYNFTQRSNLLIKNTLIPLIKAEIGNNPDDYGEMDVATFFEFYMTNIPEFWRKNAFEITTLGKEDQFRKICLQISSNSHGSYGESKKATMEDLTSDLNISKTNMEEDENNG